MVARAALLEAPQEFFEKQMTEFHASLEADPTYSPEAAVDRRIAELMEEAA